MSLISNYKDRQKNRSRLLIMRLLSPKVQGHAYSTVTAGQERFGERACSLCLAIMSPEFGSPGPI